MTDVTCRGWVQEARGVRRPCTKSGNAVLANGYCANHQYFAVATILERIKSLEVELNRLESTGLPVNASKIALLKRQIQMLKEDMDGARKICTDDSDCSLHLRDLLASIRDVTDTVPYMVPASDSSHPLNRMKAIEQEVAGLSTGTSFEDAQAFALSKEYELARRQQKEAISETARLQTEIQQRAADAEGIERKFQGSLQELTQALKRAEQQKAQADQIVASLQKRLDKCQADSRQVSGVYAETIERQKVELESFKARYNDMVGRELRLGKSVEMLTANERELQKAIEELKQSYERKLSGLRTDYAQQSAAAGGVILSEREEALRQQVDQLKQDLEQALKTVQSATEMGKEAILRATSADKPHGQIARELVDLNAMLQRKNEELAQLQAIHDRKTAEFAQAELKVAQRIDQASARDRADIQRLSNDLAGSERKLAALQQEIVSMQTASFDLKRRHQNEVQMLGAKLRDAENQLMQLRAQRDADKRDLQRQKQALTTEKEMMKADMDFKFNQTRDALNQNYSEKVRQLKDATEATQLQLNQERRNLVIAQRQAQDVAAAIEKNRAELDRYRAAYDQKMADFYHQKQALDTSIRQAEAQAAQSAQMEADYKKRIDILRQTIAVQRQRFEAQINQLSTQLSQTVANRNLIANSLEKCSAARDSIVQKVNMLTDENTRLKDMFLQMKARADMMKTQYEVHVEKMRAQAVSMQNDIRTCAQRLQDATLVHDHVQRMKDEAQTLRANLEAQIRAAKGNEQALRRLLHDRELEKQQVFRLQSALKECSIQRSQTEAGLQNTNTELRDMKRLQTELTGEIQNISQEYQRTLQQRDAQLAQDAIQQQVREETIRRELADIKSRDSTKTDQINRLQRQRQMISEALANTELERARQIQALVDAQQVTQPYTKPSTGTSSLVQS